MCRLIFGRGRTTFARSLWWNEMKYLRNVELPHFVFKYGRFNLMRPKKVSTRSVCFCKLRWRCTRKTQENRLKSISLLLLLLELLTVKNDIICGSFEFIDRFLSSDPTILLQGEVEQECGGESVSCCDRGVDHQMMERRERHTVNTCCFYNLIQRRNPQRKQRK